MSPSQYLRSGRWTYAEERELIGLARGKTTVRDLALRLKRSDESVSKKLVDLGLSVPAPRSPSRDQLKLTADARKQRDRARRFRVLAEIEKDAYIAGRLTAIAIELDDIATELDARANL